MAFTVNVMLIFRLANKTYINDLSGIGAQRYPGRWNPKGLPCLYFSSFLSLALLEKFVHARGMEDMREVHLLSFDLKDTAAIYKLDAKKMTPDWQKNFSYTQWLGQQILQDEKLLGFTAPSAIVPSEMNLILNPKSVHFNALSIPTARPFVVDERLVWKLSAKPGTPNQ